VRAALWQKRRRRRAFCATRSLTEAGGVSEELEDAVRAFLDLGVKGDVGGSVDCFAYGASYQVDAWNEPLIGHDAIRQDFDRQRALWSDFGCQLLNIGTVGNVVFTERIDTVGITSPRDTRPS
jgi:hypothetical protein